MPAPAAEPTRNTTGAPPAPTPVEQHEPPAKAEHAGDGTLYEASVWHHGSQCPPGTHDDCEGTDGDNGSGGSDDGHSGDEGHDSGSHEHHGG